jgi:hypothetical protein
MVGPPPLQYLMRAYNAGDERRIARLGWIDRMRIEGWGVGCNEASGNIPSNCALSPSLAPLSLFPSFSHSSLLRQNKRVIKR